MKRSLVPALILAAFGPAPDAGAQPPPSVLASGLASPESVAVDSQGRIFVTVMGERNKPGDGAVVRIQDGKAETYAAGLDDPRGLVAYKQWLFAADNDRIRRIDENGKVDDFVPASAFPAPPKVLNDLAVDVESGALFVTEMGDRQGKGGAVYRISPKGEVSVVLSDEAFPELHTPNGVLLDGASHLFVADMGTGTLYRVKLADSSVEKIAEGFGGADGIAWDQFGRLFVSDWRSGKVFAIARPGLEPVVAAQGFTNAADLTVDPATGRLLIPDMGGGSLNAVAVSIPGQEVDERPLDLKVVPAFPGLSWEGWQGETEDGRLDTLRPVVLTHAGDGSNRIFIGTQHGVIHALPDQADPGTTSVFLDIRDRVSYHDNTNEEGFLGLAFHPRFKENGYFYVFYTTNTEKLTNVVSRFQVRQDDPNSADPNSELEIFRYRKPYWNHDGGTVVFGPDGCLYITHGDGGAGGDPHENGQNLQTPLGKVLRLDVDRTDEGKNYAVPTDNPFVGRSDALPEVWAYGLRNIWRMSFDRKTGRLWAGDVGQNLWEEIDIVVKGGNYGWSVREGFHPFGAKGVGPRTDLIEPIWEYYHHPTGKSITGGGVYRGPGVPELDGAYLYADYVSGKIWALRYDDDQGRVVENRPIPSPGLPILSFGEDEKGEFYFLTTTIDGGRGVFKFSK